jgi:predicted CoA-substrate-specific enzyme activase
MTWFAGIDVGAGTVKAVILSKGTIAGQAVKPVGRRVGDTVEEVMATALSSAGIFFSDLSAVVATGWGRKSVPFAQKTSSEIICHALGAHFSIPEVKTLVDIGAQDSKFIRVNERGEVTDFAMNDKCAAGTGRFLEVMSQVLDVPLGEMGSLSLTSKHPCAISSTCTVFAETEVVALRAEGRAVEDLVAGIHRAIANRVGLLGSRMQFVREVVFTGGVAKNCGVRKALEEISGLKILVPSDPQLNGAMGAALIARREALKSDH